MKKRTLQEVLRLDDKKTLTHTIRLKNSLYKRSMLYCDYIDRKGGDMGLRDLITNALISFLDKETSIKKECQNDIKKRKED